MRKIKFETGEYYNVCNRGVDKRGIFLCEKDYIKFIQNLRLFNNPTTKDERDYFIRKELEKREGNAGTELSSGYPELSSGSYDSCDSIQSMLFLYLSTLPKYAEIICYCLNYNHYHLLLKQLTKNGISKLMHKLGLGYTHYFNKKNNRSGSLFEETFKAIEIKSGWQLYYVSAYIKGLSPNAVTAEILVFWPK